MKGAQKLRKYMMGLGASEVYYLATIKSVNKDNDTCVVVDDEGYEYTNVQLQATTEGKKGHKLYPVTDSDVLVERIDKETHVLRMYTEVESFSIEIGTLKFEAAELFEIKKGNETLLKLLQDIIKEVSLILPTQGTPPNVAALNLIAQRAAQLLK